MTLYDLLQMLRNLQLYYPPETPVEIAPDPVSGRQAIRLTGEVGTVYVDQASWHWWHERAIL